MRTVHKHSLRSTSLHTCCLPCRDRLLLQVLPALRLRSPITILTHMSITTIHTYTPILINILILKDSNNNNRNNNRTNNSSSIALPP